MIKDALDRLSAGQFAVSYGLFRQAVLTGPRQAVAWFGLSQASARLPTAADKAFAFAERALLTLDGHERNRLQAEVFKNFGQLLQQRPSQAHRPSAKTCFQQAVIIVPSLSSAMLIAGSLGTVMVFYQAFHPIRRRSLTAGGQRQNLHR